MTTITECHTAFTSGHTTSRATTATYLQRIQERNGALNAFLHVATASATTAAAAADARLQAKVNLTPLTGVPLAIKDIMHVPGLPTTCGSKILEGFQPPFVATVIDRLITAGAVFLGKTNMDEFAMGASNEHSAYGAVRNPWDPTRIPGGSSGGSAAAVAADLCVAALGSDTGGSIRQPAALCGIVGFKPTYGRISRYGLVAFASSLDQIGPMTKTVEDAAILYQAIAGHDAADSTSLTRPVDDCLATLGDGIAGLTIGIPQEYFITGIDPAIDAAVRKAIAQLETLGAKTTPISLPHTQYAVPCYYIIAPAEASANLARYDGIRFGRRAEGKSDLRTLYEQSRSQGFGPEVTRRIIIGTYVLSSGYYDAYYLKAQKVRTLITQDFTKAFAQVDLICSPTTPYTAFPFGERIEDPVQMYLADICTAPVNLAGLPGISVPCGLSDEGLPIGLQLIGKQLDEATVLRAAHTYEQSTDWHTKRPHAL